MPESTLITLNCQAAIKENQLTIAYEVTNRSETTIYLTNRPYQWTAKGLSAAPEIIYTEISNGTLHLVKACLLLPEDIDVEAPVVPYLTELPAHAAFSETILLSLPLVPYHPYDQVRTNSEAIIFPSVSFVVGWLPADKVSVRRRQDSNGGEWLSTDYGPMVQNQVLLTAGLDIPIPAFIHGYTSEK